MKNSKEKEIKLFDCSKSSGEVDDLSSIFSTGSIASGSEIEMLESNLCSFLGVNHAIGLSDMTSAISVLLRSLGIQKGDEILCSSFNCLSSTSAIASLGVKAIWVDLMEGYPSMCIEDCKSKLSKRTKAVFLYHIAGYPSDVLAYKKFCTKNNLILIEDANNALGSSWGNDYIGSKGDFSIFSFYPNRPVSSIEGAAIGLDNKKYFSKIQSLKKYGLNLSTYRDHIGEINSESDVEELSFNSSLSNVHAFLASKSLASLDSRLEIVRRHAAEYTKMFSDISEVKLFNIPSKANPVYWAYLISIKDSKQLIKYLRKHNIHASKLHYPNHRYSAFNCSKKLGDTLVQTQLFFNDVVCLPCGWWLGKRDIERVIDTIKKYVSK